MHMETQLPPHPPLKKNHVAFSFLSAQVFDPIMNQMKVTTFSVKTDEEAIKNVLYGGHPWIVMCKNESDTTEIWSPFMEAARELGSTAKAAITDCYVPLPQSGKTLAEKCKFQLQYKWDPLLFLCANGDRPKQVPRDVYHSEGG